METIPTSGSGTKHAEFQIDYIWIALTTALLVGFTLGTHLTFVIGFDLPLGKGYHSFIQTHGHIQLVGWVGLFIIGISLHFLPRLAGAPISQLQWIRYILWLIAAGLLLRSVGHIVLPYLTRGNLFILLNWVIAGSGLLEWCAIFIYVSLLIKTLRNSGKATRRPALLSVKPYFVTMLTGWILYASLNLVLLIQMALSKSVIINQAWNEFAIQIFTGLVLLPVAFAFSIRTFPLYLRLAPSDGSVRGLAYAYLVSFCLQMIPIFLLISGLTLQTFRYLSNLGMILKGGVIFWFVWKLDVLTSFLDPRPSLSQSEPKRRPTRSDVSDYGEFGRFDRLIYAAYIWLILGAFFEILLGVTTFLKHPIVISTDVVRHVYLLGFITHLIFGVSVRMIPGFVNQKRIAHPKLVGATFWLGNAAVVCRILPLIFPQVVLEAIPASLIIIKTAFAFSGALGWVAVFCLTVNLWTTAQRMKKLKGAPTSGMSSSNQTKTN